jgi:hypothetical protein
VVSIYWTMSRATSSNVDVALDAPSISCGWAALKDALENFETNTHPKKQA